jgi:hypothetical protein
VVGLAALTTAARDGFTRMAFPQPILGADRYAVKSVVMRAEVIHELLGRIDVVDVAGLDLSMWGRTTLLVRSRQRRSMRRHLDPNESPTPRRCGRGWATCTGRERQRRWRVNHHSAAGVDQESCGTSPVEGPHGLRAAVVELGRLADDDGPGTQDEDALQVGALGIDRYSRRACACASAGPSAEAASRCGVNGRVVRLPPQRFG